MLHKSYSKDTFDLADISLHNGIEHDASLTREFACIAICFAGYYYLLYHPPYLIVA
jgi:hypothetical protein